MRSPEVFRAVASRLRVLEDEVRRRGYPERARVIADLADRYEADLKRLQTLPRPQHITRPPLRNPSRSGGVR